MKKKDEIGKTGELALKIFLIAFVTIMSLAMFYGSIKWTYNYFTMNDTQICQESNSTLINGICHTEINRPVTEQRNYMLFGIIGLPIFAILLIVYLIVLIKYQFKKK